MAKLKPFFVRPLAFTINSTGNERAEKLAAHLKELDAPGMVWGSNGATNVYVILDLASAKTFDFVSVISANAIAATDWRVRAAASAANTSAAPAYDSGVLDFISPAITREDGLYHSHLEISPAKTYRYVRIDITSHTGDFEAAAVVIGQKIASTTFYSSGWESEPEDLGKIDISRFGIVESAGGKVYRKLRFVLAWMSYSEYETSFQPMIEALGARGLVYCCFDPESATKRQANSYFGWLKKASAQGGKRFGKYEVDFEMLSMI